MTMVARTEITRNDIMPVDEYGRVRNDRRAHVSAIKKNRRMDVGPYATFYFENYDTMWHQIHEMLYIEKGGDEQIDDELRAYNPLVPKGRELVATIMFEIPDETLRQSILSRLGGVEETVFLTIGEDTIVARPETDVDRTTAGGKASSVQFVHFTFTEDQIEAFKQTSTQVIVGIKHPNYAHMAVMPENVSAALAEDFD